MTVGPAVEGGRPAVLLVNGTAASRVHLAELLDTAGYAVAVAESGEAGVNLARSNALEAALVDASLPDMRGEEFIQRLNQDPATARISCVLLTAPYDGSSEFSGLEAGADLCVSRAAEPE